MTLEKEQRPLLPSNFPPRNARECCKGEEDCCDRKRQEPAEANAKDNETEKNRYWGTLSHIRENSKYCGGQAKHPANQYGR